MEQTPNLPASVVDKLNGIVQELDELTIDPQCDDVSSAEMAKVVRTLLA